MKKALALRADEDLRQLSRYLWEHNIPHRISEQSGQQIVWVGDDEQVAAARDAYRHFSSAPGGQGDSSSRRESLRAYDALSLAGIGRSLATAPVVSVLILMSLLVTLLMNSTVEPMVYHWLRVGSPAYMVESGEYWRLITPIFMHFNLMHLAFNMLLFWVFGHQIEVRESSWLALLLVLLCAALSNIAQYWLTGSNFGGMSGVVYGVLGYCWLWDRLRPGQAYGFPNALMGFMLVWLALGFTEFTKYLGFGSMANGAHLAGLATGLLAAVLLAPVLQRRTRGG